MSKIRQNTPLNTYDATTAPTVNEDSADGYEAGSIWIDTTNDKVYVCTDDTAGAAVWAQLSQSLSGTYTPTLTNVTNLAASTASLAQYARVGSCVTVSGKVNIDPTAPGQCQLGISLPIASNLANDRECAGSASAKGVAGQDAAIEGDTTNDRAQMEWIAVDTSAQDMFFIFMYRII